MWARIEFLAKEEVKDSCAWSTEEYSSILKKGLHLYCVGPTMALMWKSEKNLWVLDLFYHLGSKDQTQVISLGGKCVYLLSHLTGPARGKVQKMPGDNGCTMWVYLTLQNCKANKRLAWQKCMIYIPYIHIYMIYISYIHIYVYTQTHTCNMHKLITVLEKDRIR